MKAHFLVTGASRGLGRALCFSLARRGDPVVALARDEAALEELVGSLPQPGLGHRALVCDLASPRAIAEACVALRGGLAQLGGVIHNAAMLGPVGPLEAVGGDDFARVMQVNVTAVQDLTLGLLPLLAGPEQTRLTLISSGAARRAIHGWSAYCTSKAALEMWGRCAAEELRSRAISVLAIGPGVVDTDMQAQIRASGPRGFPQHKSFVERYESGALASAESVAERIAPVALAHPMSASGLSLSVRDAEFCALLEQLSGPEAARP